MLDKTIPYKILIRSDLDIYEIYEILTKLGYKFYNDVEFYIKVKAKVFYPEPNQFRLFGGNDELVVEFDTRIECYESSRYDAENKPYTELTINQLRKYLEL